MSVYSDKVHRIANCITANYPGAIKPGCDTAALACELIERCAKYDSIKNAIDSGQRDASMLNILNREFPHGIKTAKKGKTFFRKRPTLIVVGRTEKEKINNLTRYDLRDALIELMDTTKGDNA